MRWFQELAKNNFEKLYNENTGYLLNLRQDCFNVSSEYDYYNEQEAADFDSFQKKLYEILGTREHIPNKIERKAMRLEKARQRKYGH